jgi:hypothetical protein
MFNGHKQNHKRISRLGCFLGLSGEVILTKFADRYPYLSIYDLNATNMYSLVAYIYYTKVNNSTLAVGIVHL